MFRKNEKPKIPVVQYINQQENPPSSMWGFLFAFLKTKEGLRLMNRILLGVFILFLVIILVNPDVIIKLKIALWNMLLNRMK